MIKRIWSLVVASYNPVTAKQAINGLNRLFEFACDTQVNEVLKQQWLTTMQRRLIQTYHKKVSHTFPQGDVLQGLALILYTLWLWRVLISMFSLYIFKKVVSTI